MRKLLIPLLTTLFIFSLYINASATSYLKFWVDGVQDSTLTQGQMLAWETDVLIPGSSAAFEIYLDIDGSHTINEGDLLFERFQMRDGDVGGNDGPSDSSATEDGIIYVDFGSFGFAAENYLLKVTDTDNSTVTNWFSVSALTNPAATISGQVYIEGVSIPDPLYKNIMIGAHGMGMFTGLTDENGLYTINLPVAASTWSVEIFFQNTVPGYIANDTTYQIQANAGNTGLINFHYLKPRAWVYGDLRDEKGTLITIPVYLGLQNETLQNESSSLIDNGHYNVPAAIGIMGSDSSNDFRLHLDSKTLIPTYMVPSDDQLFELSWGDSLQKNLVAYTTDAVIYGYVTEDGNAPSKAYQFYTSTDTFGYTETLSDAASGYFELHVREGADYYVGLQDDLDWGTPPPLGYIVSDGNWQKAVPGETVYFNLVPAGNLLTGTISFDPGDPVNFNFDRNRINGWDTTGTNYGTRINENFQYELPVANGVYSVEFNSDDRNYLAKPFQYNSIRVSQDTVDTLNFELNYAHANLIVKLVNAPIPGWFNQLSIGTNEDNENFYQTWVEMKPDSTFHLRVCEGNWHISMPFYDANYAVTPGQDTTLVVTESDSSFYVEFVYKLLTDISNEEHLPQKFALGQNYPNPFNPVTTISYQLAKTSKVELVIYNLLGQRVATLVSEKQTAGIYNVQWDASDYASSVYYYRIEAGDYWQVKKMVILK